ncbi:DNA polymerase sliding clamp [Halorussus halophilus]|uniref:DNA polymerase sliding clamp n=1 Tax=Halorussus halophilus TaxID=2650975 RepID=UPI0013010816|nr:DNA polymerase sliding clamp [Halorussus halophilus]
MSDFDSVTTTRPFHAIVDADSIQQTVAFASALFEECHLQYDDDDGIRLSAIDAATVASVEITLESAAFDALEATEGHVGIDLSRLQDVVKMADRGQLIEFTLDTETRKLEICIDELEYTLAVIDPETIRSPPDRPSEGFDFTGAVVTDAGEFERAIRAADMVSDHLALGLDDAEEVFYVEAEGDTDDVSLTLSADELVELTPGDAHSLYSLEYLLAIERAMSSDLELDLRMGTEQPLEVESGFADGAGSVEYLLAPRISAT